MTKRYQVFQIGPMTLRAHSGLSEYVLVPIEPLVLWLDLGMAEEQLEAFLKREPTASLTILPVYDRDRLAED